MLGSERLDNIVPSGSSLFPVLIVALSILISIGFYFFIFKYLIPKRQKKYVLKNSKRIKALFQFNDQQEPHFSWDLQREYSLQNRCNSKSSFDNFNIYRYFEENDFRLNYFIPKVELIEKNKEYYYKVFDPALKKLMESIDPIQPKKEKNRERDIEIENKLIFEIQLSPILSFSINVICEYISPQGRNHYRRRISMNDYEIKRLIQQKIEKEKKKKEIQHERSLMNDSLRYDIMKRDHFRCTICGATQADGVKLHVDHILPVSKGGKTVRSNLRTLCERCNLGKKAKYDPNGLN